MKICKLIVKEVEETNEWGKEAIPKDAVKYGTVAYPMKGKTDDNEFDLKKGDEICYQYGTNVNIKGEKFVLVSLTNIIWQK